MSNAIATPVPSVQSQAIANVAAPHADTVRPIGPEVIARALASRQNAECAAIRMLNSQGEEYLATGRLILRAAHDNRACRPTHDKGDFLKFVKSVAETIELSTTGDSAGIDAMAWTKCAVLAETLDDSGVDSDAIPYHFLYASQSSVLLFNQSRLDATLRTGTVDFFKAIAAIIKTTGPDGKRVIFGTNKFRDHFAASGLKRGRDGELLPIVPLDEDEEGEPAKAPKKTAKPVDLADVLGKILKSGDASIDTILTTLAAVAKDIGLPMPSAYGLAPLDVNDANAELFVETMVRGNNQDGLLAFYRHVAPRALACLSAREAEISNMPRTGDTVTLDAKVKAEAIEGGNAIPPKAKGAHKPDTATVK